MQRYKQYFLNDSSADSVIQILSRMTLLEKHLSDEQIGWIQEHNLQLGPERLEELRGELPLHLFCKGPRWQLA